MKKKFAWILFTCIIFQGILNYAVAQQNNLKDTRVKIFRDSNFQILDNKDSLKASYYSIITYKGENVYGAVRDFYKSGMPLAVGYYNGNYIGKGYENGKFTRYYENGKIFQINNYVNGLLDGVNIEYYPSGLKKACVSYTMGKRYGCEYSWDENGKASVYNQNYANCPCATWENTSQSIPAGGTNAVPTMFIPRPLTARQILDRFIEASGGGVIAINSVNDAVLSGTFESIARSINAIFDLKELFIANGNYVRIISMDNVILTKEVVNGRFFKQELEGKNIPLKNAYKESMKERSYLFSEYHYLNTPGYSFEVKGEEDIEGKSAYVIEITSPIGRIFTNYYDKVTGYKLKASALSEVRPGKKILISTKYSDVKTFYNLKIPTKIITYGDELTTYITIKEVKINTGLTLNDFK